MHDGQVGDQPALHHVAFAIELAFFFSLTNRRAGAGARKKSRDAGTARADALRQRALRVELDLELAREILLRKRLVLADIGRNHFLDLPAIEQEAETDAVDSGVVGDDRQIFDAGIADRLDQRFRNATKPEAPRHDQHAVLKQAGERRLGVEIDLFFHEYSV